MTQPDRNALRPALARHRGAAQALLDGCSWGAAVILTTRRPPSFSVQRVPWQDVALLGALAVVVALAVGTLVGLYAGRWTYGSFEEVMALVPTVVATGLTVLVLDRWLMSQLVPIGAALSAPALALILMCGTRYVWRLNVDRHRRPDRAGAERLLVYGAGPAGTQIVGLMLSSPSSEFVPVALLDDDPDKRRWRIKGVPVVGGRDQLATAARRYGADGVLLAMPSAPSPVIRALSDLAAEAGLQVYVLPGVRELVTGRAQLGDIRELTEVDLLGRAAVDTDVASIAGYVTGQRVLVTGAGGSIGSELCRQLARFLPAQLVMLDRDESALHAVQLSIEGRALLDTPNLVVADLRDAPRMAQVFREHRPQVIFHAAALKHLTLLERHPGEAVKTNVWGTLTLLDLAAAFAVDTFVNISTDKAADPVSVLGSSKRLAERLTAEAARRHDRRFLSVRFGNVVGSRGSVLLTFRSQIASGGPVTVTDPGVSRFFMTVEEAVQLVVQAGALGSPGEVLVLDMGEPVQIADLARRLIRASGQAVDIEFTGLRPGEKMHEDLVGVGETAHRSSHPLVMQASVPPLDPAEARALDPTAPDLAGQLLLLCRTTCHEESRLLNPVALP
ncbi:MAG: polysaccharide biosynthesis protein [Pseudorhodobacter sp.]|nr:polysaccharide biosynthesis protein [Frankiaceae bacterium]